MKRKVDWNEKERSDRQNTNTSEEPSDSEEPRFKNVLESLFQAFFGQKASDLLHKAASKKIVFRTPRGQSLRNWRIILVTNISELIEYVLLPHNAGWCNLASCHEKHPEMD